MPIQDDPKFSKDDITDDTDILHMSDDELHEDHSDSAG